MNPEIDSNEASNEKTNLSDPSQTDDRLSRFRPPKLNLEGCNNIEEVNSKNSEQPVRRKETSENLSDNNDSERVNLADLIPTSPTHAHHLGIFKFMPFEHKEKDDTEPLHEALEESKKGHDALTTKEHLKHILHSKAMHLIIIFLVIIDSILVIFELLFDLNVIQHDPQNPIRAIFHGFSVGILTMFMIELVLKLWADHHHFIRHKIEVLDAVVVVVSWVIDIVLVFINSPSLLAVELLLLLRLWRVFRIVNGIIVAVKTKADERVQEFKLLNKHLSVQLQKAREKIDALQNDVRILRNKLNEHDIKIEDNRI